MSTILGFIGPIGWQELLIILALVLIIFGPRKLPEIAEAFGKSINKFKSATRDATDEVKKELEDARRGVEDDPAPKDRSDKP